MDTIKLNRMPAPTWNRLELNDIKIQLPEPQVSFAACGDEAVTAVGRATFPLITDVQPISGSAAVMIDGNIGKGFTVTAEKGASLSVIQYVTAGKDTFLRTFADVKESASLRLIQVFIGGADSRVLNDVGAVISDSGNFDITQIFLCGGLTVSGIDAELNGYKSAFSCKTGYLLKDSEQLDINNIIRHRGRKTNSRTDVKGVLYGQARKIFRGTIDFLKGSAGSVGTEKEDVLLMDETVVNKTVPVILCAEEDVDGSHGASIGRLSEETLYYMTSRGIPEKTACELIAAARLEGLINTIGDADIIERAAAALAGRCAYDGIL